MFFVHNSNSSWRRDANVNESLLLIELVADLLLMKIPGKTHKTVQKREYFEGTRIGIEIVVAPDVRL